LLSELLKWNKLRRFFTYAVYMLLAMFIQGVLFSRLTVLGVRGLVLPAAAVAVGLYQGGVVGAVFGLVFGFFADMGFSENTVLFTVLFPLIGFGAGFASDFFVNKSFFAFMLFSALAVLLTGLVQMLIALVGTGAELFRCLFTVLLQLILSLLPMAVLYLPFRSRR